MKLAFYCRDCSSERIFEDPINTEFPCPCGGTYRMKTTGPARTGRQIAAEPAVTGGGTIYDLLQASGNSWWNKPLRVLQRYKVAQCRSCGKIQVTEAEAAMTCRSCGKRSEFRKEGRWHTNLKDFDTHPEALKYMNEWTMREKR
jgi:hypothetical protein